MNSPTNEPSSEAPILTEPPQRTEAERAEFMKFMQRPDPSNSGQPGSTGNAKPRVRIPGGTVTITESAESLFRVIAPKREMFYRGGTIVRLIDDGGAKRIEPLSDVAAQSVFEKYVTFEKEGSFRGHPIPLNTSITQAQAKQYLSSDECRQFLPKLKGIVNCPILIERNRALHRVESGYDKETGLYIANSTALPVLSIVEAVTRLTGLLEEFRFKTHGDRSRALMSLITPALKLGGFIKGKVPVEVAEADQSQSGKTYRQTLIAALYREKMATVTKRNGGAGSMEETFQQQLVNGRPFIQFDNVRGPLNSQLLESFLTSNGTFSARTAYKQAIDIDPSSHFIFISSNGFQSTEDLGNRCCIVRIIKRPNHNFKTYADGLDLAEHVYTDNVYYLAAVFKVIETWFEAGKPRTVDTRHDFREWCQICDWIVINIFKSAPLMDGHGEAKERAANPNLTFFRNLAVKLQQAGQLNVPMTATNLAEFCADQQIEINGLSETSKEDPIQRRIQVGKIMKSVLDDCSERCWEGFRLTTEDVVVETATGNDLRTHYTVSVVGAAGDDCNRRASGG